MGARGPVPTPTQILDLRGSWRGKTRPDNEPEATGKPVCPRWLSADAKKHWQKIVPELMKLHLVGKIDSHMLARYCQLWARWRACEEFIAKFGMVRSIKDKDGVLLDIREFPQVERAGKLHMQMVQIERQFGMSPSARASLVIDKQPEKPSKSDEKDRYFQAG